MKFRKKPVVIEAEQFNGTNDPPGVYRGPDDRPYVVTIHGQPCYLSPGDWIVPEPDGVHYYPIKPDIFEATYDPVADAVAIDWPLSTLRAQLGDRRVAIEATIAAGVSRLDEPRSVHEGKYAVTYHVAGIYGDEGENRGVLALTACTDPSPEFPSSARIIVGSPSKSPLQEGYIPNVGGFNMGLEVAGRVISTLQRAIADVQTATGAPHEEEPPCG